MILSKKQISLVLCFLAAAILTACLDSNESETIANNISNPTVKSMTLEANSDVCSNLSSYAFTIDNLGVSDPELIREWNDTWVEVENVRNVIAPGIIFNPDSLPIGSIADSIKVKISYSSPSSVKLYQYDLQHELKKVVNYKDTQTIWFDDYAVTRLEIISNDHSSAKSYFIKMNVHKCAIDTIVWNTIATDLFDATDVVSQRVDTIGSQLCWFTTLTDGTQQMRTSVLTGDVTQWSSPASLVSPSVIDLGSLYSWGSSLYAIGSDHSLLTSNDGTNWTVSSTDFQFTNILGVQLGCFDNRTQGFRPDSLCAIVNDGTNYHFAKSADGISWKLSNSNIDGTSLLPAGFPLNGYTRPISVAPRPNSGNTTSRLYIVGGTTASGEVIASTWTCDGNTWAEFTQAQMPAMSGASIVQYTRNVDNPRTFWILHPGILADGSVTRKLYFSENSGVTWKLLEKEFSEFADTSVFDAMACNSAFYAPNNWKIYFFGGTTADGNQTSGIRSGVLPNLTLSIKR